jgi:hypothetical protein
MNSSRNTRQECPENRVEGYFLFGGFFRGCLDPLFHRSANGNSTRDERSPQSLCPTKKAQNKKQSIRIVACFGRKGAATVPSTGLQACLTERLFSKPDYTMRSRNCKGKKLPTKGLFPYNMCTIGEWAWINVLSAILYRKNRVFFSTIVCVLQEKTTGHSGGFRGFIGREALEGREREFPLNLLYL